MTWPFVAYRVGDDLRDLRELGHAVYLRVESLPWQSGPGRGESVFEALGIYHSWLMGPYVAWAVSEPTSIGGTPLRIAALAQGETCPIQVAVLAPAPQVLALYQWKACYPGGVYHVHTRRWWQFWLSPPWEDAIRERLYPPPVVKPKELSHRAQLLQEVRDTAQRGSLSLPLEEE